MSFRMGAHQGIEWREARCARCGLAAMLLPGHPMTLSLTGLAYIYLLKHEI